MKSQEAVDRVNEAINHLDERMLFKGIMSSAFVSGYGGGGITISVPVFGGCIHFEVSDIEVKVNSKIELVRLVKIRLLAVLDNIRSSVYETDSAAESKIFSGMSFEEIQTAAGAILSSDKHASTDDFVILIANLAARMKEKE